MRIGIDGSSMLPPRTGVGNYTRGLVGALPEAGPDHHFVIFLNSLSRQQPQEPFHDLPNVEVRRRRIPGSWLVRSWRYLKFPPIERLAGPVDVFHSPATYIPPQNRGARVTTVHDLYFAKRQDHADSLGGAHLAATLPRLLPAMDRIITPTQCVRLELIERYGIGEDRVRAIHEGVDHRRFRPGDDPESHREMQRVRRDHGLPERFILTVSTLEPRKNLEGLFAAYKRLADRLSGAPPLAVVGARGWQTRGIHQALAKQGLQEGKQVIFTGYAPDEDLPPLYNAASLFVLASHDEGFGLPLLEAMACGVPALTSRAPALAEVGASASARAEASDPEAFAEKMREILSSQSLRESMRQAGLARAAEFSWERCARETLEVYLEAAK